MWGKFDLERSFLPLYKKDNVAGFLVSRTVFGGDANAYHSVLLLSSFADIDRGLRRFVCSSRPKQRQWPRKSSRT
jgi:hypothetical protein